jgi:ankyrin repeat protein
MWSIEDSIKNCIDIKNKTPFDPDNFRESLDCIVSERGSADELRRVVDECREEIKQVLILEKGYPLLHYSAFDDDNGEIFEIIVELWLEAGLSIDYIYEERTALEIAIHRNNDDGYRILIEQGADVNIPCKYGYYPLMRIFDSEIRDKCLIFNLDDADLTIVDDNGFNLMHYAVTTEMEGVNEVLINLLNKGFSPNVQRDGISRDPLSLAIEHRCPDAVRILVEHGAYVRYSHLYLCLTTKDVNNYNSHYHHNLYHLYYRHHGDQDMSECIFTMLDHNTINLNTNQYYKLLSNTSDIDIIKRLMTIYHPSINISSFICNYVNDGFNQTLVHKIVYLSKDVDLIRKVLFEMDGVRCLNMKNIHGNTPLHIAAMYRSKEVIGLLIDAGSDKTIENEFNNTPAQSASYYKRKDISVFIDEYNDEDIKEPEFN